MHYPDLNNVERWKMALDKVETPYVCFCPDDDFHGFNALKRCVSFLNENIEYSTVQGRYLSYYKERNHYNVIYTMNWDYDVKCNDFQNRMIEAVNPYMIHLWAVHRTEFLKWSFHELRSISNGRILELHFTIAAAIFGKLKVLPYFYCLREAAPNSWGRSEPPISEWIDDADGNEEFLVWKNNIVKLISDTHGLTNNTASILIESCLAAYNTFCDSRKGKSAYSAGNEH